jgi:hypothetical protein
MPMPPPNHHHHHVYNCYKRAFTWANAACLTPATGHAPGQGELAIGRQHDVLHEVGVATQGTGGATVVITLGAVNVPHNHSAVCKGD